jgi:hypothetical protein
MVHGIVTSLHRPSCLRSNLLVLRPTLVLLRRPFVDVLEIPTCMCNPVTWKNLIPINIKARSLPWLQGRIGITENALTNVMEAM